MIMRFVQLKLDHKKKKKIQKMHERHPTELNWLVIKLDSKVSRERENKAL